MAASMSYVGFNHQVREMYARMSPEQTARENEHAARLRKASEAIIEGPKLDRFGNVWIPSPVWEPPAVAEFKRRGGRYHKLPRLFDAWSFQRGTLTLDEARELYAKFFGPWVDRERCILLATGKG